jgi:hypothetical protein
MLNLHLKFENHSYFRTLLNRSGDFYCFEPNIVFLKEFSTSKKFLKKGSSVPLKNIILHVFTLVQRKIKIKIWRGKCAACSKTAQIIN